MFRRVEGLLPSWRKDRRTLPAIHDIPFVQRVVWVINPKTGKKVLRLVGGIATDVGGTLLNRYTERDTPLPVEEYPNSHLFEGARQAIRLFVILFGEDRVFIIKNDGHAKLAQSTYDALEKNDFFEGTGLLRKNFLTTEHRGQKYFWCNRHNIDFMIDDKAAVGRYLNPATHFIQFRAARGEERKDVRALYRRVEHGSLIFTSVDSWREVLREILSWYPILGLTQLMQGRSRGEQADIIAICRVLIPEIFDGYEEP